MCKSFYICYYFVSLGKIEFRLEYYKIFIQHINMNIQEAMDYGHFCDIESLDPELDTYFTKYAKLRTAHLSIDKPGDIVTQNKKGQITVVFVQPRSEMASRTVSFCICVVLFYVLHELLFIAVFLK